MLDLIEKYLETKQNTWSKRTHYTVSCALKSLVPYLTGDAKVLWDHLLERQKPYSRVTTWRQVTQFWGETKPNEENPYRKFRQENKQFFKNKYIRRPATETMKEAKEKIDSITDPAIKKKAFELLYSAMRWAESLTIQDGYVVGKGGRERQVHVPKIEGPAFTGHYRTFLRALKDVGLKPHTLRKIALTACANNGASSFELMEIAGWRSLSSATAYIGVRPERAKQLLEGIRDDGHRSSNGRLEKSHKRRSG